jgi:hypothetical protein
MKIKRLREDLSVSPSPCEFLLASQPQPKCSIIRESQYPHEDEETQRRPLRLSVSM